MLVLVLLFEVFFAAKLLDYQFGYNFGQVIYDYSGFSNHGQNGESIFSLTHDTMPTDRGAYYSSSRDNYILIPPNSINPAGIPLVSILHMTLWYLSFASNNYIITYRNQGQSNHLKVQINSATFLYNIEVICSSFSGNFTGKSTIPPCNFQIDNWNFFSFLIMNQHLYLSINGVMEVVITQNYNEVGIYNRYLGYKENSLEGFVWNLQFHDQKINENNYYSNSYIGSNCLVPNCIGLCSPAIKLNGTNYCMSTNKMSNQDGQQVVCPTSCLNTGCSSSVCLDCSGCISMSCVLLNSKVVCLCEGGIPSISGCSCPLYQYFNISLFLCDNCLSECLTCLDKSSCLSCKDTNAILSNSSFCICKDGFFNTSALSTGGLCTACNYTCKTCLNPSQCITCLDPNAVLDISGCICLSNYFNGTNGCQTCYSECLTCSSEFLCVACVSQNSQPDLNIGCLCTAGYYNTTLLTYSSACLKCHGECLTCSQAELCTICITDNAVPDSTAGCLCSAGFYNSSALTTQTACIPCSSECLTCSSGLICLSCSDSNSYLDNGLCLCVPGFFKNTSLLCEPCKVDCKTCIDDQSCVSCEDPAAKLSDNGCSCIEGYYNSSTSSYLKCSECLSDCLSCSSITDCLKCAFGNTNLLSGACLCPENSVIFNASCRCNDGFYLVQESQIFLCRACDASCKVCSGPNPSDCLACSDGFFFNKSENLCAPCSSECSSCDSADTCTNCKNQSAYLANGKCITCGTHQYFANGSCFPCPALCVTCKADCKLCVQNAVYQNDSCVCELGYELNNSNCIAKFFYFSVNVSDENKFEIIFSEPTLTNLKLSDFSFVLLVSEKEVIINSSVLIKTVNSEIYMLDLSYDYDIPANNTFVVTVLSYPVFSQFNSQLLNYSFQGTLRPKTIANNGYFSDFLINSTKPTTSIMISSSLAMSIVSSPGATWSLLNTIEMIAYLPLNNNTLTPVLRDFLTAFSSYNIIPNILIRLFNSNSTSPPSEECQNFGITSSVILVNTGSNFLVFLFVLSLWPILFILVRYTYGKFSARLKVLLSNYKFNFFIRSFIQFYLELGIYSIIQLKADIYDQSEGYFNKFLAVLLIILVILAPYFILVFSYVNKSKIFAKNEEFYEEWGSLYEEFKLNKGFWSSQYYFVYCVRRLLFSLSQIYLNSYPVYQGSINIALNIFALVYLLRYLPFKSKSIMLTNIIGELCTNVVFIFAYFYSFEISSNLEDIAELGIIFAVIVGLIGQFLVSFFQFFLGILELWAKLEKARAIDFLNSAKKTLPQIKEEIANNPAVITPSSRLNGAQEATIANNSLIIPSNRLNGAQEATNANNSLISNA